MNDPKYKDIDLVEQFYKENIDLKAIQKARAAKKPVTSGLEPYTGEFGKAQKKHLLNRTMMGYAHSHFKDIENLTLDQAIELIFTPETKPDPPVNDYYHEVTRLEVEKAGHTYVSPGEPFHQTSQGNSAPYPRYQSLYAWLFRNQIHQNTSIHWKMVFYLHNLLATQNGWIKRQYQHMMMLHDHAFRSFKSTIKSLTLSPRMLDFLNLQVSKKEFPDENYARELQELFTIGKGNNSNFTEEDVASAARILVGWGYSWSSVINEGPITNVFNPDNHDIRDKVFSQFYNNTIIKGKAGEDGKKELDELIDLIFSNKECALHQCRRLYQFFVDPMIDQFAEDNIISPMAEILRENDFQLIAPLKALLRSTHFFDNSFYYAMIKSPVEYIFGIMKEFEFEYRNHEYSDDIPDKYMNSNTSNFYRYRLLDWTMNNMGLSYLDPPSVSGWPAYYQAPVYDLFWINSVTIAERTELGNQLGKWGLTLGPGDSGGWVQLVIDRVGYLMSLDTPTDIDNVIDQVSDRLLAAPMSETARVRIKNGILDGQSETHFTELVEAYLEDPSEENKNTISGRLEHLFTGIFQMGEFQLY